MATADWYRPIFFKDIVAQVDGPPRKRAVLVVQPLKVFHMGPNLYAET